MQPFPIIFIIIKTGRRGLAVGNFLAMRNLHERCSLAYIFQQPFEINFAKYIIDWYLTKFSCKQRKVKSNFLD